MSEHLPSERWHLVRFDKEGLSSIVPDSELDQPDWNPPVRFHLVRTEDETGVSGTGVIVEGVEFTNGVVVLRWLTDKSSIAIYDSIADVIDIHGHGGKTVVRWVD